MRDRFLRSMIMVAVAAAAVSAVVTVSITQTSGAPASSAGRASRHGRRQAQLQRASGRPTTKPTGFAGACGASRRRHAAGRLWL